MLWSGQMDLKTVPKCGHVEVDPSLIRGHLMRRFRSRVFALAIIIGMALAGAIPARALDASALMQRLDIVVAGPLTQTMAGRDQFLFHGVTYIA